MLKFLSSLMKASGVAILLLLFCIGGCYGAPRYKYWRFDHIEQSAKRMITPAELQTWATNLLARFPTYSQAEAWQTRTNYPAQLRPLCRGMWAGMWACWVSVVEEPRTNSAGAPENHPEYVMIIWSMKPSGDAAFEIGPTNFVSGRRGASDVHC